MVCAAYYNIIRQSDLAYPNLIRYLDYPEFNT